MSVPTYELAGSAHTEKDEEVTSEIVKSTQTELNGNVSMLIKVFKLGAEWGHSDRVRETMINNSLSICPMYLLYKDHKGCKDRKGCKDYIDYLMMFFAHNLRSIHLVCRFIVQVTTRPSLILFIIQIGRRAVN